MDYRRSSTNLSLKVLDFVQFGGAGYPTSCYDRHTID